MEIKIPIYHDVWLDNGLITFYMMLKDMQEETEDEEIIDKLTLTQTEMTYAWENSEFLDFLKRKIIAVRQNLILETVDKKTSEKKEIKKDHILIQEEKKIAGKVALKENIYKKNKIEQTIKDIYESLGGNKKNCLFCNRFFKKIIKKMQQASYPFVTKIKSLSGIRSGKNINLTEYFTDYCPQCYLNGILEWTDESLIYRTIPGTKSILILPGNADFKKLYLIKKEYTKLLNNNNRWCNIKTELHSKNRENEGKVESPPDKYSTLLSFYENYIRDTKSNHADWFIIEIPSGSVKNPKYFHIKFGSKCIKIIRTLIETNDLLFYRIFIKEFYAFFTDLKKGMRDYDREKELKEKMCQALVTDNFDSFCRCFSPRKGVRIGLSKNAYQTLEKLLNYWRINDMNIENKEEYLKTLQMGGQTIATIIDNGNRLNLFFKLEKARNKMQFLEALQEISRRLIIDKKLSKIDSNKKKEDESKEKSQKLKIYPSSIASIIEMIETKYDKPGGKEFFKDAKNILLIYTSIKTRQSKGNSGKKEDKGNE